MQQQCSSTPDTQRPILSVGILSQRIRRQISPMLSWPTQLIQAQWIKPQANKGQKGFFSVTLADTQNPQIAIEAMIWERSVIQRVLEQGQQFGHDLLDRNSRVEVIVEATLGYWASKNAIYVLIHQLSTIGMLGMRQQQREAAVRTLKEEGLLTRNASLLWPMFPLRVGIIGKQGSDAIHDILGVLNSSPYRFDTTIFHTAVQGVGAIPGLLKAFHDIAMSTTPIDVIILARGGGKELDLLAFDNIDVARAVATASKPVLTGLGHHLDRSICDEVAAKALSTPTAAAQHLVSHLDRVRESIVSTHATVVARGQQTLMHWSHTLTLTRRLIWEHARATIEAQAMQNEHCHERIHRTLRDRLLDRRQVAATRLITLRSHLEQRLARVAMEHTVALVRLYSGSRSTADAIQAHIRVFANTLALSDPRHVLALGYAYLVDAQGHTVTSCHTVNPGARLQIHLQDGIILATHDRTEGTHEQ